MKRKDLDAVQVLFSIRKTLVCYQHCFREKSVRLLDLFKKKKNLSLVFWGKTRDRKVEGNWTGEQDSFGW